MTKAKEESKEVAVAEEPKINQYALMHVQENIGDVIRLNLGDEELNPVSDLEKIKTPSGGSTLWEIPDMEEGVREAKELEGVIVHTKTVRLYWAESFDDSGGGTPPDCYSDDGVHGIGDPGGKCKDCPMSQWGSGPKGKGQACSQRRLLFVMLPDSILPALISVPPTSLQSARQYLVRLAGRGMSAHSVFTKMTLTKDKNDGGISYSKINFTPAGKVENPELMQKYVDSLKPFLQSVDATEAA